MTILSAAQKNQQQAKQYSLFIALLTITVGLVVLIGGWALDIAIFRTVLPSLVSMKANTALAFILSSLSLILYHRKAPTWASISCALSVGIISLLTLIQIVFDQNFGIDEMFFVDKYTTGFHAGRMSVLTCISFIFISSALLIINKVTVSDWRLANGIALLVAVNAFISMLGYLYGVGSLYQVIGSNAMAIHTAVLFFLLAMSIVLSRSDVGLTRLMTADSAAGLLMRRLLPAAIFLPPILGWLRLEGQHLGWFDLEFGSALYAVSNLIIFSGLIWWAARAIERADKEKQQAQQVSSWQQAILNSADLTIISTNLQGIILTCNEGALTQLGYQAHEVIGKATPVIFHDPTELKQRAQELSQQLQQTIEPTFDALIAQTKQGIHDAEWTYIRKDGSLLTVSLSTTELYNNDGQLTGFLCIGRDISQRKQHEQQIATQQQALHNEYQRNQAVLDFANYSIIGTDTTGIITTFNKAAEALLGYSASEVINRISPAIFHLPKEVIARSKALSVELNTHISPSFETFTAKAQRGDVDESEWTYVCKDGKHTPVLLSITAIHDEKGDIIGFLGIASDITERQRIERMKSEFVSTVSHELRTPLTSIRGSISLVLGKASSGMTDKAKVLLETANRNCERLSLLINDILDLEKIESGMLAFHMSPIDMVAIAKQSLINNEGYAQQHQVKLILQDNGFTQAQVLGDEHRLLQVFANLLSNAIKYSHANGAVTISMSQHEHLFKIGFKDHGAGIPKAFHQQIFQRFSQADSSDTRAKGGTGLGLSITKAIIERHGGTISYDTQEGVGTEFYIRLPLLEMVN